MATVAQIKNLTPMYHKDLEFDGADLFSKYGFGDGDILEGHIEMDELLYEFDNSLTDLKPMFTAYTRIATLALAELYLLPLFDRPLTLNLANYLHNGCRVIEPEWWDNDWEFSQTLPKVIIPSVTVYSMLYSMRDALLWWQAGKPLAFPACLKQTAGILADELKVPVTIDNTLEFACSPSPLLISDAQ